MLMLMLMLINKIQVACFIVGVLFKGMPRGRVHYFVHRRRDRILIRLSYLLLLLILCLAYPE